MKKRLLLSSSFLVLLIASFSQKLRFISVRDAEIIGVDGNPFLIKGTNTGNWLVPEGYMFKFEQATSPRMIQGVINQLIGPGASKKFWQQYLDNYITPDDIHYLKKIGSNSVRIPFHYKLFTDEDYLGGRGEKRGFALLDRVINWCRMEGLYVLLDMHCAPGGQTGDNIDDSWGKPFLFDDPSSQELTIAIWKKIATRYANNPIVMGYDLLNEPIAHFFDTGHYNPRLVPLYKRITKAIRSVDKNHLIFLGGAQWDSNFDVFGPPFDNKLVYTFHKYWTATTIDVIQSYIAFRNKYKVPIYCGETGENSDEWVSQFRQLLDEQKIGWHFWPYKKMDNTSGIYTFPRPEGYDEIIKFANADRGNYEKVRQARPKDEAGIQQALNGFLQNCLFKHCIPNKGYISALGLKD